MSETLHRTVRCGLRNSLQTIRKRLKSVQDKNKADEKACPERDRKTGERLQSKARIRRVGR
jgi:hypothetical protein